MQEHHELLEGDGAELGQQLLDGGLGAEGDDGGLMRSSHTESSSNQHFSSENKLRISDFVILCNI